MQAIVEQTRLGRSPAQIVADYDGVLTLAQVHDALSYFYEHQGEIEQEIARNRAALHRGPVRNFAGVKLYVDADITPRLARALRERGYDVLSAHEASMADASDSEQMAFAATQERVLLTCNAGDFTAIFEDYWDADREHSGLIVQSNLNWVR